MTLKILMFGPQGSGKGTQARKLSFKYDILHISVGQMYRDEIEKNTEIGKKAQEIINKGMLMPDEITNEVVKKRLEQNDVENGYLLDGYPRNLVQAQFFDQIENQNQILVVKIHVSDEISVERISGRRICHKCGRTFHIIYDKPQNDEICDDCGSKLVAREDDMPDVVKKRLLAYHQDTEPLINFFKTKENFTVLDINGEQSIDDVFSEIDLKISEYDIN